MNDASRSPVTGIAFGISSASTANRYAVDAVPSRALA
jgi:hypothetical protein